MLGQQNIKFNVAVSAFFLIAVNLIQLCVFIWFILYLLLSLQSGDVAHGAGAVCSRVQSPKLLRLF